MKKTILVMALLLTLGLLVAGCNRNSGSANGAETQASGEQPPSEEPPIPNTPDAYVDEQIIDETQTVEIGEMI